MAANKEKQNLRLKKVYQRLAKKRYPADMSIRKMIKLIEKRQDLDKWLNGRGGLWDEMYQKGYKPSEYQNNPKVFPQFDVFFDKINEVLKMSESNEKSIERLENKTGLTEGYAQSEMNRENSRLSQSYAGMSAYLPMPEKFRDFLQTQKQMSNKCNNFESNRTDGYKISDQKTRLDKEISNFEQVKAQSEKYNMAPKLSCKRAAVTLPNGERVNGVWKVVSAFDILPSHNPRTYGDSKNFPLNREGKNVNDRNYSTDRLAQSYVASIAQRFDGRAIEEPIRISLDGIVVDGNNRCMSRILAHENNTDMAYIEALYEFATEKCICHDDISQIKAPTMVFEIDAAPTYTRTYFAAFNKNTKKEKSAVDTTVTLATTVSPRVRNIVNGEFDKYDNLSELYANRVSTTAIRNALVDGGVILENELNKYFDAKTGSFTDEGKTFLQRLVLSDILSEDNIRVVDTEGLKSIAEKLLFSIVPMADNQKLPEDFSLSSEINAAIDLLHTARRSGMSISDLISQGSMFEETQIKTDYSTLAVAVALSKSKSQFKKVVNLYNTAAKEAQGGSLFGLSEKRDKAQILGDTIRYMQAEKMLSAADEYALKRYQGITSPRTETTGLVAKTVAEILPTRKRQMSAAETELLQKEVKKRMNAENAAAKSTPSVQTPKTNKLDKFVKGKWFFEKNRQRFYKVTAIDSEKIYFDIFTSDKISVGKEGVFKNPDAPIFSMLQATDEPKKVKKPKNVEPLRRLKRKEEKYYASLEKNKAKTDIQSLISDLKEALKYIKATADVKKYSSLVADLELAAQYQ